MAIKAVTRERIFCIGDTHFPFCSKQKITKMLKLIEELKPTIVIQMGDLVDAYSFSKFPKSLNILSPRDEIIDARDASQEMWNAITNRAKKAKKFQLKGNHCDRPYKRLIEKAPELEDFMDFESLWKFKGVKTIQDSRDPLIIDDIYFIHGHKTKWLDHVKKYMKSIVYGHTHRGGCLNWKIGDKQLFELNCGYLGDPNHEALLYRPMKKFDDWTHGVGFIDRHGGRFIAL